MGAVAANRYRGDARFTTDLDLLVAPDERLPGALRDHGYAVTEVADSGERPHLLIARRGYVRVDLLPAVVRYQQVALERAANGFLTLEDVLVHKLIAWRRRDQDDIRSILEASRTFDSSYVADWAVQWGVEDRWSSVAPGP